MKRRDHYLGRATAFAGVAASSATQAHYVIGKCPPDPVVWDLLERAWTLSVALETLRKDIEAALPDAFEREGDDGTVDRG